MKNPQAKNNSESADSVCRDTENEAREKAPRQVSEPLGGKEFKHYWDLFSIALAIFIGLWVPLRIVVLKLGPVFDLALDGIVLVYILANHFGVERSIRNRKTDDEFSRWAYQSSKFVDVLIALPVLSIAFFVLGKDYPFLLLTKLILVRRILLIRTVIDAYHGHHPVMARLIPIAVVMPLVVHFLACGWIFLGGGNLEEFRIHGVAAMYLRSVYWTITTLSTVGYGDIAPQGLPQMLYANFTMIVGIGFFGFVLSNVASMLARIDAAREDYLGSLDKIESYMRYNEVPNELRLQVREYYRYLWENHWGRMDSEAIEMLPSKLRENIALHISQGMIEKVPFLVGADERLLRDIVTELKMRTVVPGEEIFRQGDPGLAMYFIHHGQIDIIVGDGHVVATLPPGSFFGEGALLMSRVRSATARSQSYADIYVLEKEAFYRVLERHSDFREHIHSISEERQAA